MGRLSKGCTFDPWGNRFWCLGQSGSTPDADCVELECTYDENIEIVNYYINRFLVTQDSLIVEFSDLYDNEQTKQDIKDHLATEAGHVKFLEEHGGQ